jgi:hypothetical protein
MVAAIVGTDRLVQEGMRTREGRDTEPEEEATNKKE